MEFQYAKSRIFSEDADGTLLAEVSFPFLDGHRAEINHVFVDEALRGQGIASQLMELAYQHLKKKGMKIVATCPYAIAWFTKHPENQDIVLNMGRDSGA